MRIAQKGLKDYPVDPQEPTMGQLTDRDRNRVELRIFRPKDHTDTWMYVQSQAKQAKETSTDEKLKRRFEEELGQIKNALHTKGGTKKIKYGSALADRRRKTGTYPRNTRSI